MELKRFEMIAFAVIFLLATALLITILLPYLAGIVLAFVFYILFEPLYRKILHATKDRATFAALATIALVLLVILIPLTILGVQVFEEARELYAQVSSGGFETISGTLAKFFESQFGIGANSPLDVSDYAKEIIGWIVRNFSSAFERATNIMITFFLSLFALYYLLKDRDALRAAIVRFSPLSPAHTTMVMDRMGTTIAVTIKGSVVIAILQGLLSGLGLYVFGVPNPAIWGTVASVAALLPFVGTTLVSIPAALFLFLTGKFAGGIGLLLWGILVVGTIDNFLKPRLIGHGVGIHPFLILLSVLGGIGFFGAIGFILGPLCLSFFVALLGIYLEFFKEAHTNI